MLHSIKALGVWVVAVAAVSACGGSNESAYSGGDSGIANGVCSDPRCTAGSGTTGTGSASGVGAGGASSGAGGALGGSNTCGNGTIEAGEQCEAGNLNQQTCATVTMGAQSGGILQCSVSCTFDTTGCRGAGTVGGSGGAVGAGGGVGAGGAGTGTGGRRGRGG